MGALRRVAAAGSGATAAERATAARLIESLERQAIMDVFQGPGVTVTVDALTGAFTFRRVVPGPWFEDARR